MANGYGDGYTPPDGANRPEQPAYPESGPGFGGPGASGLGFGGPSLGGPPQSMPFRGAPQAGGPYYGGAPQQPKKNQTVLIILIAALGVVALLAVGIIAAIVLSSPAKAEAAYSTCADLLPNDTAAVLTSDGKSIRFSSGESVSTTDLEMLDCLMDETGAPDAVDSRMGTTRALDGTQDATWDGWSAFWNYHPDDGLYVTFTAE